MNDHPAVVVQVLLAELIHQMLAVLVVLEQLLLFPAHL
jgi:hypothetical protein